MLSKITGGVAAGLMFLTFIFTIVGMAGPWWTAEQSGVTTKITLWKVEMDGYGQSGSEDIDDICSDYRDGCEGWEDSEQCETPLKNCLLIQANRAFVILDFICALVAAVLDIVFAVMLCVKGVTDCCSKCCGVGGIVLTVFCMILSIISIALGAGVDFDGMDMNGGGFACMVLAFIFSLICTVLSCIGVCSAKAGQA